MEEIWKDISGYEGLYQVSNYGNIKSLPKKKGYSIAKNPIIIKPFINCNGYLLATLCKNNNQKHFQVHRLVAEAFIQNIENKPQVDHINRVRSDNRVENLRWVTVSENGNNTCFNRSVEYKGEIKTVSEWSEKLGIKQVTLHARLFKYGWDVDKAFTTPVKSPLPKSQERIILEYFENHDFITQKIASKELGIGQLNSRIWGLRKKGYVFNKHKSGNEIRYYLIESEE